MYKTDKAAYVLNWIYLFIALVYAFLFGLNQKGGTSYISAFIFANYKPAPITGVDKDFLPFAKSLEYIISFLLVAGLLFSALIDVLNFDGVFPIVTMRTVFFNVLIHSVAIHLWGMIAVLFLILFITILFGGLLVNTYVLAFDAFSAILYTPGYFSSIVFTIFFVLFFISAFIEFISVICGMFV